MEEEQDTSTVSGAVQGGNLDSCSVLHEVALQPTEDALRAGELPVTNSVLETTPVSNSVLESTSVSNSVLESNNTDSVLVAVQDGKVCAVNHAINPSLPVAEPAVVGEPKKDEDMQEKTVSNSNVEYHDKRRPRRRGRRKRNNDEETSTSHGEVTSNTKKKKKGFSELLGDAEDAGKALHETEYYFENGLRKVKPYMFTFLAFCKGRWEGRKMVDVFQEEFQYITTSIYNRDIANGTLTVNGKKVKADYSFRGNELVAHTLHRHEMPVAEGRLKVITETDDFLVIDKPCSIPVHPCGKYRHNSILYILMKEHGFKPGQLKLTYRLDRLTSGVLILAKNLPACKRMMKDIQERNVQKVYLCKVDGEFPEGEMSCKEPIDRLDGRIGVRAVVPNGKLSTTNFQLVSTDGKTSIVKCFPRTGRTHQIRVHLQYLGYPIVNDPLYNGEVWGEQRGKGAVYGKSVEQLVADLNKLHSDFNWELPSDPSDVRPNRSPEACATLSAAGDGSDTSVVGATEAGVVGDKSEVEPKNLDIFDAELAGANLEKTGGTGEDANKEVMVKAACERCRSSFADPTPDELVMYLHALRYEGPGWCHETDIPSWAQETS